MKSSKQIQRGAGFPGVGVSTGEKHHGRFFFGGALQVVQHIMRANIGKHLANARQEHTKQKTGNTK